ncbi:hypothetical protein [Salinisphaera sp. G21_0]|uniref:hypothetical protein n=1 Tax=Salinisphaera sp. G21_0 TaxID=2821094 RepID=UPI001AD958B8|nr:hypothetical protein [Salinisphaera sp. G21_0]MBO9482410.1 hypothetical protein [Salinisphaera sp. G21_0]
MSIQAVDSIFSVYNYDSQSKNQQSNADPLSLLHKYNISARTPTNPEDSFGSDIFGTQQADLDKYLFSYSDNGHDNDAISSILNAPLTQQTCSSGSETETGESAPASLSNPVDHLTDLPVGLSNPQNIQPAADNPLNLYHTTSDNQTTEKVTVGNSSRVVEQKGFCKNPLNATERQKQRQRERYQNDPDYAERIKKIHRERQRELRKDPVYLERQNKIQKDRQRKLHRERSKDPAYAERLRQRHRERRKDPAYVEHLRKRQRERQRERYQNDPDYAERQRERQRELRKNHAYMERRRKQQIERYHNKITCAEHKRTPGNNLASAECERVRQKKHKQNDSA